jgi:ABC-type dipeptide/oligopeptide/nickel transport system ATPase component
MHDQAIKNKRDTVKLKNYYRLLLEVIPENDKNAERRKEIKERIKNIDEPVKFG